MPHHCGSWLRQRRRDDRARARHQPRDPGVGLPYEGDGAARWLWVAAGARMLAAGWPDERSIGAALVEPVDPLVVTRFFEEL